MDTTILRQVREALDALAEAPLADIPALLEQHCPSEEVRRRVRAALDDLHKDDTLGGFLDTPAIDPSAARLSQADEAAGRRIGRYELVRILGEGGMGTVYEARQENPRRRVALKVLKSGVFSPSALRRFERESTVLGLLHHSGIAQIYEAGVEVTPLGRLPFFAMELVQGDPLDTWAQGQRPDPDSIIALVAHVCDAVHHAHTHGVIHRDLKPGNIMVTGQPPASGSRHGEPSGSGEHAPGPFPKILDFGVARVVNPESGLGTTTQTEAGQIVGTLTYMSPEQVSARFGPVGPRTDVYALGAILYELLAGRPALDVRGRTIPEATNIIAGEDPPRLRSLVRRLDEDVETIVAKAMEKEPKRRYASAAELAMDLRRYLHKEPIAARPATTIYQLRRFAARNRTLVGGVLATFAALAIGLAGTLVFAAKAREQSELARRRADEAERKSYLSDIRAAQAAVMSDESALARASLDAAPANLRGWEWDHLNWSLDRGGRIVSEAWPGGGAFVTGYGNSIIIAKDDIYRVDVDSGERQLIATRPGRQPARFIWCTPDGRYLRIALGGPNVELWDLSTRQLVRDYSSPATSVRFVNNRPVLATNEPGGLVSVSDALSGRLLGSHPSRELTADLLSEDGSIGRYILDLNNARYTPVPPGSRTLPFQGASAYVSPRGRHYTMYPGRRQRWDVLHTADGSLVGTIETRGDIASHGFSYTHPEVAISTSQGAVEVWDLNTVARRLNLSIRGISRSIRFTPDGRWLLAADQDGRVRRWDASTSASPFILSIMHPLALSPDARRVVGRNWGFVRCWDTDSGKLLWTALTGNGYANAGDFSPDGKTVALALSGMVLFLNADTGEPAARSATLDASLFLSARFGADGRSLFLGSADGRIVSLSDADGWQSGRTLPDRHASPISAIQVSPDGAFLATASGEGRILHDVSIPAGSNDSSVRLWNTGTLTPVRTLAPRPRRIADLCFSPDGRTLYGAGTDGALTAWSIPDGALLWERPVSENGVTSVSLRPDGRGFVVGESLGAIHLLGAAPGMDVVIPRAVPGICHIARFTPDGATLLAATGGDLTRYETGPPDCGFQERESHRRARAVFDRVSNDGSLADRLDEARRLCDEWGEDWPVIEATVTTDGEFPNFMNNSAFITAVNAKPGDKDLPRAIRLATRATELVPDSAYYWDSLALALLRSQDLPNARIASDRAAAADNPANPSALHQFVRALILHATADEPAARQALERGRALMSAPANASFGSNSVLRTEAERLIDKDQ